MYIRFSKASVINGISEEEAIRASQESRVVGFRPLVFSVTMIYKVLVGRVTVNSAVNNRPR